MLAPKRQFIKTCTSEFTNNRKLENERRMNTNRKTNINRHRRGKKTDVITLSDDEDLENLHPDVNDDIDASLYGLDTSVFCEENHIYFRTDVRATSVNKLISIINDKNREFDSLHHHELIQSLQPKPLYLHITSFGGLVFNGLMAVDAIINSRIPVYTIVDGYAASAATIMSVVGKKRYMTANSNLLIHQITSGAQGTYHNLKDAMANNTKIMEDIKRIYYKHTNISDEKKLDEYLSHDLWWGVEECIKHGIVDEVYVHNDEHRQ